MGRNGDDPSSQGLRMRPQEKDLDRAVRKMIQILRFKVRGYLRLPYLENAAINCFRALNIALALGDDTGASLANADLCEIIFRRWRGDGYSLYEKLFDVYQWFGSTHDASVWAAYHVGVFLGASKVFVRAKTFLEFSFLFAKNDVLRVWISKIAASICSIEDNNDVLWRETRDVLWFLRTKHRGSWWNFSGYMVKNMDSSLEKWVVAGKELQKLWDCDDDDDVTLSLSDDCDDDDDVTLSLSEWVRAGQRLQKADDCHRLKLIERTLLDRWVEAGQRLIRKGKDTRRNVRGDLDRCRWVEAGQRLQKREDTRQNFWRHLNGSVEFDQLLPPTSHLDWIERWIGASITLSGGSVPRHHYVFPAIVEEYHYRCLQYHNHDDYYYWCLQDHHKNALTSAMDFVSKLHCSTLEYPDRIKELLEKVAQEEDLRLITKYKRILEDGDLKLSDACSVKIQDIPEEWVSSDRVECAFLTLKFYRLLITIAVHLLTNVENDIEKGIENYLTTGASSSLHTVEALEDIDEWVNRILETQWMEKAAELIGSFRFLKWYIHKKQFEEAEAYAASMLLNYDEFKGCQKHIILYYLPRIVAGYHGTLNESCQQIVESLIEDPYTVGVFYLRCSHYHGASQVFEKGTATLGRKWMMEHKRCSRMLQVALVKQGLIKHAIIWSLREWSSESWIPQISYEKWYEHRVCAPAKSGIVHLFCLDTAGDGCFIAYLVGADFEEPRSFIEIMTDESLFQSPKETQQSISKNSEDRFGRFIGNFIREWQTILTRKKINVISESGCKVFLGEQLKDIASAVTFVELPKYFETDPETLRIKSLACILAKTTLRDIRSAAKASKEFFVASELDSVWLPWLPPRYQDLLDIIRSTLPSSSKDLRGGSLKRIFRDIADRAIFLHNRTQIFRMNGENGKTCLKLSSKGMRADISLRENCTQSEFGQIISYRFARHKVEASCTLDCRYLHPGCYDLAVRLELYGHHFDTPLKFFVSTEDGQSKELSIDIQALSKGQLRPWKEYVLGDFILVEDAPTPTILKVYMTTDDDKPRGGLGLDYLSLYPK